MKKEDMEKKVDQGLGAIKKGSEQLSNKMDIAKKKLGEFAPSVMIAIGVTLLMAVLYHPNTVIVGAVVGLVFAAPVLKKKFLDDKKASKKAASKESKTVKAEVVEEKSEETKEEK